MKQSADDPKNKTPQREIPSLWKSIILVIIFVFGAVGLFGVMVYLFISGAQQLGLPFIAHLAIFVVISGIFAWLVKRISDTVSGMSHYWFPEEFDDPDR